MGLEAKCHEAMTFGDWENREQQWSWYRLVYTIKTWKMPLEFVKI